MNHIPLSEKQFGLPKLSSKTDITEEIKSIYVCLTNQAGSLLVEGVTKQDMYYVPQPQLLLI